MTHRNNTVNQRSYREKLKARGLKRGDVWLLEEDWPLVRELEKKSKEKALEQSAYKE
jgi:hypothetical protein